MFISVRCTCPTTVIPIHGLSSLPKVSSLLQYLPARKPTNRLLVMVVSNIKNLGVIVANTWDTLHQGGKESFELSPQWCMSNVYSGLLYGFVQNTSTIPAYIKYTFLHTSPWYQYHRCHSFAWAWTKRPSYTARIKWEPKGAENHAAFEFGLNLPGNLAHKKFDVGPNTIPTIYTIRGKLLFRYYAII